VLNAIAMKSLSVALVLALTSLGACVDSGAEPADDQAGAAGDGSDEASVASDLDEVVARHCDNKDQLPNNVPVGDDTGVFTTVSAHGSIDLGNEFFQDLGSNGRRCVSCHVPTSGWTLTPKALQTVFDATDGGAFEDGLGLSAVFRTVDGSNAPNADVSSVAKRRKAYSMLLSRGVIRIGLAVPANAEFELVKVDDPYHFASASELSLFRRPLPTTNLKFDSTVMWDGREVVPGQAVATELSTQANDATLTHAQGKQPLTQAQRDSIVNFETALATSQIIDRAAGDLRADGAQGGPDAILAQDFYIGINDNFGDSKTGAAFNPVVFNLFDRWTTIGQSEHSCASNHSHGNGYGYGEGYGTDKGGRCSCHDSKHGNGYGTDSRDAARRAVARGQAIFNTRPIAISGVSGINDEAAFGKPATLMGTCTTCHDTPNGGNHSVVAPLNIGLVDASRRTADMPLYTLRNKTTGETVQVTDPGRAMIDGKWAHIGRFKGPMLRDLAPRAPYFHNGFAKDLDAAVDFYNDRFNLKLSKQEHSDLVAFLRSL
jgi:cytochrome c peroxidase